MLHLTIGTNNLVLTLQNPLELTDVTIRFTSQSTGASTSCDVATPLYDGRVFTGTISVNSPPTTSTGVDLTGPDFPQGFFLCEVLEGAVVMGSTLAYLEYEQAPISYDGTDSYLAYDYGLNCEPVTVTDGDGTLHQVSSGGTYTCISTTPPSGIYYQRPRIWTQFDTSATAGTPPWHKLQGTYNYTPPVKPQYIAAKANQYLGSDSNCVLADLNAFGNTYRYTNDIGQQYTEGFNGAAGNNSPNKKYCIDHLSGLAFYVQLATTERVNRNWQQSIDYCNELNYAGFGDWRLVDLSEVLSVWDYADTSDVFNGIYSPWADPGIRNYGGYFAIATREIGTGRAYFIQTNGAWLGTAVITSNLDHVIAVRNHYT
jgi:hypothetical protein